MIAQPLSAHPAAAADHRQRVLCVDDEPNVLEGLALHLRRRYEVSLATSGAAALEALGTDGGVAVVISDMRMPGMDGAAFLSRARQLVPDATRMLLTGQADLESAIAAVNEGQVFRFLTKPCPPSALLAAVEAAAVQHRLVTSERVLLEQTLRGSVQALTDVLSVASPAAFGRGARLKRLVVELARDVGMDDAWEIEVAAMLAQVGAVTLPDATAEKLCTGEDLTEAEAAMIDRVPAVTERILANIPRLEGVQQVLANYTRRFDSEGLLPVGSRMLAIAAGYDRLQAQGVSPANALDRMRSLDGVYDPELLEPFARIVGANAHATRVRELALAELEVGMTLVEDVRARDKRLLISHGHVVTENALERLRNFPYGEVREPLLVLDEQEDRS